MSIEKKTVCMIVQDRLVKGGIAAVISGYYGSKIEKNFKMIYVESYTDGGKILKLFKAIKGYLTFLRVLLFNKPDIVHIHSSFGPSFYRKIPFICMAKIMKRPIINHIHGADFEEFYGNAKNFKKILVKYIYNKCTVLVALSNEWKEKLSQIVPRDNIVVIENYGILHEEAINERNSRECNNIVLFLGELGKRKGCYDIPNVVELVKQEIPNVKFILAGSGKKEEEKAIKQKVLSMGVDKNIEYPGWVRDEVKDRLLRKADLFFLPSYNEGMPMSILDAMGYGLPIVTTNVGGIPKLVENGKNGFILEPGDYRSMATGIMEILKNKTLRFEMGMHTYEIMDTKYSLNKHLDAIEQLYIRELKRL